MKRIVVTEDEAGARLDAWMAAREGGLSRTQVQKLVKAGGVTLDGKPAKANAVLKKGDVLEIHEVKTAQVSNSGRPSRIAGVKVVDETPDFLVIEKPSGLLVHPAPSQKTETLVDFLLARDPKIAGVGDSPERPGIVHRLDREASGLMVAARTPEAFARLKRQFQEHAVKKEYLALVYGKVSKDVGTIETAIGRKKGKGRMSARTQPIEGDKEARSAYEVLERFPHASLVRIRTETGRMHQVRVHMKSLGHPLVADDLYAPQKLRSSPSLGRCPRLFLHAAALGFRDLAGEWREYHSELPEDLHAFLNTLQAKHKK
jgi:23S rRNA pseudouridine1911/1915/1917 synthase